MKYYSLKSPTLAYLSDITSIIQHSSFLKILFSRINNNLFISNVFNFIIPMGKFIVRSHHQGAPCFKKKTEVREEIHPRTGRTCKQ